MDAEPPAESDDPGLQDLGMGVGQGEPINVQSALVVLVKQMQISAGAVVDKQRRERLARDVAFYFCHM